MRLVTQDFLFSGHAAAQSPRPPMPLIYASRNTSRCPLQDSRPGWIRYFLSCRALASPTTCRFNPAHSGLPAIHPQRTASEATSQMASYFGRSFSARQPRTSAVNIRTIGRESDLVGIEVRPLAWLRSRETAQDSALRIDFQDAPGYGVAHIKDVVRRDDKAKGCPKLHCRKNWPFLSKIWMRAFSRSPT